jgi:hypothetical protein
MVLPPASGVFPVLRPSCAARKGLGDVRAPRPWRQLGPVERRVFLSVLVLGLDRKTCERKSCENVSR